MICDIKISFYDHSGDGNAGFSMIEVLLAISIFAIGILAIAAMQITSIHGNTAARYQSDRSTLAQDKMEELMALDFSDAAIGTAGNPHTDSSAPSGFSVTWNIIDDNPSPGGKLVTVTVSSQGGRKVTTLVGVITDI